MPPATEYSPLAHVTGSTDERGRQHNTSADCRLSVAGSLLLLRLAALPSGCCLLRLAELGVSGHRVPHILVQVGPDVPLVGGDVLKTQGLHLRKCHAGVLLKQPAAAEHAVVLVGTDLEHERCQKSCVIHGCMSINGGTISDLLANEGNNM